MSSTNRAQAGADCSLSGCCARGNERCYWARMGTVARALSMAPGTPIPRPSLVAAGPRCGERRPCTRRLQLGDASILAQTLHALEPRMAWQFLNTYAVHRQLVFSFVGSTFVAIAIGLAPML